MKQTALLQELRSMRFEQAYDGWRTGRLSQCDAAQLLCVVNQALHKIKDNPFLLPHRESRPMPVFSIAQLSQDCQADWQAYCQHAFVRQLGAGTLPAEAFRHYLKQDYLFLVHFSRAWGLAVYKSRNMAELRQGLAALKAIVEIEMDLHIQYCADWGISEAELAKLPESRPTTAYTRYVLDTGMQGGLLDLHVALAPCLIGYAEIARWLSAQPFTVRSGNPYETWIAMYESAEFQAAAHAERNWLDAQLAQVSPARYAQLADIFGQAARLEADFWQMGLTESALSR